MKQRKLIQKVYEACMDHNDKKLQELRKEEFAKILKRKTQGKPFTHRWTVVQL